MGVPVKRTKGKKPQKPQRDMTAEEYFEEAQMALISDDLDQAKAHFRRALELEPDNIRVLDIFGGLLAEVGPKEEALVVLQKAVALQPEQGFEKYMYLGQLLEGAEAVASVRKGVELLRAKLQILEGGQLSPEEEEALAEEGEELDESEKAQLLESIREVTKEELSSALCALGETLVEGAGEGGMAGVEAEVEAVLGEARTLSPENPEPLQALCILRRQQNKPEEALALLKQSMALWFEPPQSDDEEEGEEKEEGAAAPAEAEAPKEEAAAPAAAEEAKEGSDESSDDEDDEDASEGSEESMDLDEDDGPSYEFRFECAKLLLELDNTTETAIQVLEELIEENDQVPNVWLLLAVALRGAGELEGALEAASEGLDLVSGELPDDDELVIALKQLKTELEQLIQTGGGEAAEAQ